MSRFHLVYRRGHVFWWRRHFRLSGGSTVEIRLSLQTYERSEAVSRGAALTAASGGVTAMLNRRVELSTPKPTEAQLQAIARAAFDELLGELCNEQRSSPYYADLHSAGNLALADYYGRLTRNGGHMSLLGQEEQRLADGGWDEQRIADLRHIVKLREDEGVTRLRDDLIDVRLRAVGLEPTDEARWMTELVLYPAYRDAHLAADEDLRRSLSTIGNDAPSAPTKNPAAIREPATVLTSAAPITARAQGLPGESAIPEDWRTTTPTEAAERLIAYRPALWAHRKARKRAMAQVGEQTLRQIRWAATLLEKSMKGRPLWTMTQVDLKNLDEWFDRLPITCGKAPWHREPATTLEDIVLEAEERIEAGDCEADVCGLQVGTTNKHYRKLGQIHDFMCKQVSGAVPQLDFSTYISPDIKDERSACAAYTVEQGKEPFLLPPWTGCQSLNERFVSGNRIFYDALFFVLLLVWYTGMRREEVCKLLVDDVKQSGGIWHFDVKMTSAGRVKNLTSVRLVAISDELIRLGFIEYVHAIRAAGHDAVFPELVSERKDAKKGDTFYKLWWIYIKPLLPSLKRGQALHAARHMVETELKELEIFPESRDDALGHKSEGGEGPTRYAKVTRLRKLQDVINQIPIVTDHLPDYEAVRLLPASHRQPRVLRVRGTATLVAFRSSKSCV